MNYAFSKRDTTIVKGIAILAMLFHHTYPNNPGMPIHLVEGANYLTLIAESGKICVSLLTILSGYGLAESYKKLNDLTFFTKIKFCLSHYIQLLSMYWCILLWAYIVKLMQGGSIVNTYGTGIHGIINIIIDILGLGMIFHSTILIGGWYLTAVITFYALFPILFFLVQKLKWGMLVISYIPWIYYLIINDVNMHTDWWLFYVFSFTLGIYLSQTGFLCKQKEWNSKKGIVISVLLFVISLFLRAFITLPIDPLLSFAMIELEIYIFSRMNVFASFLYRCGMQSANIWLLQVVVIGLISGLSFITYPMRYIFLVFLCMGISILIEEIKGALHYNELIKNIRRLLT